MHKKKKGKFLSEFIINLVKFQYQFFSVKVFNSCDIINCLFHTLNLLSQCVPAKLYGTQVYPPSSWWVPDAQLHPYYLRY